MTGSDLPMPELRPFDPLRTAIRVLTHPVDALRAVAAARPWRTALLLIIAVAFLSGLSSLLVPAPTLGPGSPQPLPPDIPPWLATVQDAARSGWLTAIATWLSPLWLVLVAGIYFLLARLFGGSGQFSALFATLGFAQVPSLLSSLCLLLLSVAGGDLGASLRLLVSFAFGIWALILQVLGIRESMHLSTGRAIGVVATLFAIALLLSCLIGIVVVIIIIVVARAALSS